MFAWFLDLISRTHFFFIFRIDDCSSSIFASFSVDSRRSYFEPKLNSITLVTQKPTLHLRRANFRIKLDLIYRFRPKPCANPQQ